MPADVVKKWSSAALFTILVAAVFSVSFHHFDEHFQVLEYANLKLNLTPPDALAWEFQHRMRAWLQPSFYWLLVAPLKALGLQNPFLWAFVCRLATGLLLFTGLRALLLRLQKDFAPAQQAWIWGFTFFLFFVPYLGVRTSSETFASVFLLFALVALLDRRAWLVGFCVGLCFQSRFAMGPALAGLLAYALWQKLFSWRNWLALAATLIATQGLGLLLDYWGYGEWSFPAWNYLRENLVHGKAAGYGVSPPWAYLYLPSLHALAPLTLALTAAWLLFFWRERRQLITWVFLPHVLAHSFLSHKEPRFLFPLAFSSGYVLLKIWPQLSDFLKRPLGKALILINLLALAFLIFFPHRNELRVQKELWDLAPEYKRALHIGPNNPFHTVGLRSYFYRRPGFELTEMSGHLEPTSEALLLVDSRRPSEAMPGCTELWRSFPAWTQRLNYFGWQARTPQWTIYRCE